MGLSSSTIKTFRKVLRPADATREVLGLNEPTYLIDSFEEEASHQYRTASFAFKRHTTTMTKQTCYFSKSTVFSQCQERMLIILNTVSAQHRKSAHPTRENLAGWFTPRRDYELALVLKFAFLLFVFVFLFGGGEVIVSIINFILTGEKNCKSRCLSDTTLNSLILMGRYFQD